MSSLLVVVGLTREARIVGTGAQVLIGGGGLYADLGERPAALMSFGLCGALDPRLHIGDLVLGETVTGQNGHFHTDRGWTAQLAAAAPGAKRMGIAAGPEIVASRTAKSALRAATGAGAVDMESHLVAEAAARLGIPFAVLRSVSDRADHSLPGAAQAGFGIDGRANVAAVLMALLARPFEFPALIRTALNAETAFTALGGCREAFSWRPEAAPELEAARGRRRSRVPRCARARR